MVARKVFGGRDASTVATAREVTSAQPDGRPSTTGKCMYRNTSMMLSPVTRLPTALATLTPTAVSLRIFKAGDHSGRPASHAQHLVSNLLISQPLSYHSIDTVLLTLARNPSRPQLSWAVGRLCRLPDRTAGALSSSTILYGLRRRTAHQRVQMPRQ
jgi:hypothetical protein